MPSENFKSKRYGPAKNPRNIGGTNTVPYGGGIHENDHPPLPVTPDFRDDTRAAEVGGLRGFYDARNWTKKIDQAALAKIRRDFMFPRVTSK